MRYTYDEKTKLFHVICDIDPEECPIDDLYELHSEVCDKILVHEVRVAVLKTIKDTPKVILDNEARMINDLEKVKYHLYNAIVARKIESRKSKLTPEVKLLNAIFGPDMKGGTNNEKGRK